MNHMKPVVCGNQILDLNDIHRVQFEERCVVGNGVEYAVCRSLVLVHHEFSQAIITHKATLLRDCLTTVLRGEEAFLFWTYLQNRASVDCSQPGGTAFTVDDVAALKAKRPFTRRIEVRSAEPVHGLTLEQYARQLFPSIFRDRADPVSFPGVENLLFLVRGKSVPPDHLLLETGPGMHFQDGWNCGDLCISGRW